MKVYNDSTISGGVVSKDAGKTELSKDSFLKILAAQLQYQNPMNAGDSTEYISQMAQYSAVEQMQNLNETMNEMLLSQKFLESSTMIGKIAKVSLGDSNYATGEVTMAKLGSSTVNVVINGKEYSVDDIVELSDKGGETQSV